jgi:transposase InsO family protein
VCVDDCTGLAYVEVSPGEGADNAIAFLQRAIVWFNVQGVEVQRLMSHHSSTYGSAAYAAVCLRLGIQHLFAHPYRPDIKVERLGRTLLREWADAVDYVTAAARTGALAAFLERYNAARLH